MSKSLEGDANPQLVSEQPTVKASPSADNSSKLLELRKRLDRLKAAGTASS